jgi:hypothetical protein
MRTRLFIALTVYSSVLTAALPADQLLDAMMQGDVKQAEQIITTIHTDIYPSYTRCMRQLAVQHSIPSASDDVVLDACIRQQGEVPSPKMRWQMLCLVIWGVLQQEKRSRRWGAWGCLSIMLIGVLAVVCGVKGWWALAARTSERAKKSEVAHLSVQPSWSMPPAEKSLAEPNPDRDPGIGPGPSISDAARGIVRHYDLIQGITSLVLPAQAGQTAADASLRALNSVVGTEEDEGGATLQARVMQRVQMKLGFGLASGAR